MGRKLREKLLRRFYVTKVFCEKSDVCITLIAGINWEARQESNLHPRKLSENTARPLTEFAAA